MAAIEEWLYTEIIYLSVKSIVALNQIFRHENVFFFSFVTAWKNLWAYLCTIQKNIAPHSDKYGVYVLYSCPCNTPRFFAWPSSRWTHESITNCISETPILKAFTRRMFFFAGKITQTDSVDTADSWRLSDNLIVENWRQFSTELDVRAVKVLQTFSVKRTCLSHGREKSFSWKSNWT